jgi:hypothetical protein
VAPDRTAGDKTMRLDTKGLNTTDKELITNALGVTNWDELDTSASIKEEMEACEDFEEVENGAESCFRFKVAEGAWCFIDNNNYVSIEDSKSWREYMSQWDKPLDFNLMQFCLGDLIEYNEITDGDDYEGRVQVFKKTHKMSGYNESGWELDDYGDIKIYDSIGEAREDYPEDSGPSYVGNNEYAPTEYIICQAD